MDSRDKDMIVVVVTGKEFVTNSIVLYRTWICLAG